MRSLITRLWPGLALILLAALVLLLADGQSRRTERHIPVVAVYQHATHPVLDSAVQGCLKALTDRGLRQGAHIQIVRYNAHGDMALANTIARTILDSRPALVITFSTPSLQTMAAANASGRIRHVFGVVTDPYAAGVGIAGSGAKEHPPWLTGIGTFQPVKQAIQMARKLNARLTSIGVVWDPTESNSAACVQLAREECARQGIQLVEVTVSNSNDVAEATRALVSRRVEAILVGGDNTVEASIEQMCGIANRAGIPVFGTSSHHAGAGALFGLGADYYQVGVLTGQLAARVIHGESPAGIGVENKMPQQLAINEAVATQLSDRWTIPDRVRTTAAILYDPSGALVRTPKRTEVRLAGSPTIVVVDYVDSIPVEESWRGMVDEWKLMGLRDGEQFRVVHHRAQGDLMTLNNMVDDAKSRQPDLIIVTTTPGLQAALRRVTDIPIVFGVVGDPIVAGAGKSATNHAPNVTGVSVMNNFANVLDLVQECLPSARSVGTLFTPSEANSVRYVDVLSKECTIKGLKLITVPVQNAAEVPEAALALAARRPDAIVQISDNVNSSAFSGISAAAWRQRIPLFGTVSGTVTKSGAAAALAVDFEAAGRLTAQLAVRVLQGEQPRFIPFHPAEKERLLVNLSNASKCGLRIPDTVLKRADVVIE